MLALGLLALVSIGFPPVAHPWNVVAADDKENARLIVSQIVLDAFDDLKMSYPETIEARRRELLTIRKGVGEIDCRCALSPIDPPVQTPLSIKFPVLPLIKSNRLGRLPLKLRPHRADQIDLKENFMLKLTTLSLAAAAFALPAMAQTSVPPAGNHSVTALNAPATRDTAGNTTGSGYNSPSTRNSVMTDNGGMRTSKIVGSSVYNDNNEKIGSIDDLVIGSDHSIHAVLSVGGFLGMDTKLVEVPFNKLKFSNAKESSDNGVVLPGTTKQELTSMPDYHFVNRG